MEFNKELDKAYNLILISRLQTAYDFIECDVKFGRKLLKKIIDDLKELNKRNE